MPDYDLVLKVQGMSTGSKYPFKGKWNSNVMTYEEAIYEMNCNWPLLILSGTFTLLPVTVALLYPYIFEAVSLRITLMIISGTLLFGILFGLSLFVQIWVRYPRSTRIASVRLKNIDRETVRRSLKEMVSIYDLDCTNDKISPILPKAYKLKNGIKIKARFSRYMLQPYGSIGIYYKLKDYHDALNMQLLVDHFFSRKNLIQLRSEQG